MECDFFNPKYEDGKKYNYWLDLLASSTLYSRYCMLPLALAVRKKICYIFTVSTTDVFLTALFKILYFKGLIVSAINDARSMDIKHGMVNVNKFIQYITENHE